MGVFMSVCGSEYNNATSQESQWLTGETMEELSKIIQGNNFIIPMPLIIFIIIM